MHLVNLNKIKKRFRILLVGLSFSSFFVGTAFYHTALEMLRKLLVGGWLFIPQKAKERGWKFGKNGEVFREAESI